MANIDLFGPTQLYGGVTARPSDPRAPTTTDTFFKDCSSPEADDGTQLLAAWFNQVLANMRSVARANGLTGGGADIVVQDNASDTSLLNAISHLIQRGQYVYGTDAGTADAFVVTLSPAPPEYKDGMQFLVKKANSTNATTTPTINVNGLGAKTIVNREGAAVDAGGFLAGGYYTFSYDATGNVMRCVNYSLSKTTIKQMIFAPSVVKFITPGAWSWTVPAGVTIAKIIAWGAGGGGGFSATSGGSGGGAGGYGEQTVTVTPGGTLSGVVGAGGAAATSIASNASGGGNTTVTNSTGGTTYTAQGGAGGASGNGQNNSQSGGSTINFTDRAMVGQPSGGTVWGYDGAARLSYAGNGGQAPLGGVAGQGGTGSANPGQAPGSGGGGSGSSQAAGAGARGEVWILY